MDDVDLRICQLLFRNSRVPQRDLADLLDMNLGGVHRRIGSLIDQKIITRFTANISMGYLKAIPVQVEGISDCRSVEREIEKLDAINSVETVLTAAANLTTVSLLLRDISDLGPTVERVRDILQMDRPSITISMKIFAGNEPMGREYTGTTELSRIDYRIIRSLHNNARKPVVDVAEEIGLTQKTVRHHLEEMERDGSIEYGVVFDPTLCPGSTFILRIDLRAGTDKLRYAQGLNQRFGARILLTFIHGNLPDSLCAYCWAPTAAQHYEMTDAISADDAVTKVGSGIVHREWVFETWRVDLLNRAAREPARIAST